MTFARSQTPNRTFWYLGGVALVVFALVNAWVFTHPHSQILYAIAGPLVSLMFIAANWRQAAQKKKQPMQGASAV